MTMTDQPRKRRAFIYVKQYRRPIGRRCMHCGRPATVTAVDNGGKFRHEVRYCEEHARQEGAIE